MEDLHRITTEVEHLRHAVFGNGKRGLVIQVEDLAERQKEAGITLDAVAAAVKVMARTSEAELNQLEGSRRTLRQIRAVALAILGILSAGGTWLFTSFRTLVSEIGPLIQ